MGGVKGRFLGSSSSSMFECLFQKVERHRTKRAGHVICTKHFHKHKMSEEADLQSALRLIESLRSQKEALRANFDMLKAEQERVEAEKIEWKGILSLKSTTIVMLYCNSIEIYYLCLKTTLRTGTKYNQCLFNFVPFCFFLFLLLFSRF